MKKVALIMCALAMFLGFGVGSSMAQPGTGNMAIDAGGIGDLLLFAGYDVRPLANRSNNWQNFLVIENTTDKWTAFHLRIRSWKKSIEIYDHVILLSPFDVFWAVLEMAKTDGYTREGSNLGTYNALTNQGARRPFVAGKDVLLWSTDYETCLWSALTLEKGTDRFDGQGFLVGSNPPATAESWIWITKMQMGLLDDTGFVSNSDAWKSDFTVNVTAAEFGEMYAGEIEAIGLWSLENPYSAAGLPDKSDLRYVVDNTMANDRWYLPNGTKIPSINVYDVMNALYYEYSRLFDEGPPVVNQLRHDGWQLSPKVVIINETEAGWFDKVNAISNDERAGLDCGNVLAGAFSMGDTTTGQFALSNMVAIRDFRTDLEDRADPPSHRDGAAAGYIVFPWETIAWTWDTTLDNNRIPFYVNEGWATTVGPGLRDGDDWNGSEQTTGGCAGWGVTPFNEMWSLDELEEVLANNQIWYHYFNNWPTDTTDYKTYVTIGFFSKHYHFFFADWPWWNRKVAPYAAGFATQTNYWRALYDYRGDRGAAKIGGTSNRSVESPNCNSSDTIKEHFASNYTNGKVTAWPFVWDMEENKPVTTPEFIEPPGSPWRPIPPPEKEYTIPHEVNIIKVMATAGTGSGVDDANGLLTNDYPDDYAAGHFAITGINLTNGQRRAGRHYSDGIDGYFLPSIGVVTFELNYANQGITSINLTRSAMAPWHFRLAEKADVLAPGE